MASAEKQFESFNIVHPKDYADQGYPHDIWTWMRANDPVYKWEDTEGIPFWAITKHADVTAIGRAPDKFLSGPRLTIDHKPELAPEEREFFPPHTHPARSPQAWGLSPLDQRPIYSPCTQALS